MRTPSLLSRFLLVIIWLGVVSVAGLVLIRAQLGHIQDAQNAITKTLYPARFALSEAKASSGRLVIDTYRAFLIADPQESKLARRNSRNEHQVMLRWLDNAGALVPDRIGDIDAIKRKAAALLLISADIARAIDEN